MSHACDQGGKDEHEEKKSPHTNLPLAPWGATLGVEAHPGHASDQAAEDEHEEKWCLTSLQGLWESPWCRALTEAGGESLVPRLATARRASNRASLKKWSKVKAEYVLVRGLDFLLCSDMWS